MQTQSNLRTYEYKTEVPDGSLVAFVFATDKHKNNLVFTRTYKGETQQINCEWNYLEAGKITSTNCDKCSIEKLKEALYDAVRNYLDRPASDELKKENALFPDSNDQTLFYFGVEQIMVDLRLKIEDTGRDANTPDLSRWSKVKETLSGLFNPRGR